MSSSSAERINPVRTKPASRVGSAQDMLVAGINTLGIMQAGAGERPQFSPGT